MVGAVVDELAEIETRHPETVNHPTRGIPYCPEDGQYWPCDAIRLVAEVRRLKRENHLLSLSRGVPSAVGLD